MGCGGSTLEIFRRLNRRFTDDVVGQGINEAVDDNNVTACHPAVHGRGSDGAAKVKIAGDESLNGSAAAVNE